MTTHSADGNGIVSISQRFGEVLITLKHLLSAYMPLDQSPQLLWSICEKFHGVKT